MFSSKAFDINSKRVEQLWNDCGDTMYSLTSKTQQLGFGEQVRFPPKVIEADNIDSVHVVIKIPIICSYQLKRAGNLPE